MPALSRLTTTVLSLRSLSNNPLPVTLGLSNAALRPQHSSHNNNVDTGKDLLRHDRETEYSDSESLEEEGESESDVSRDSDNVDPESLSESEPESDSESDTTSSAADVSHDGEVDVVELIAKPTTTRHNKRYRRMRNRNNFKRRKSLSESKSSKVNPKP